MNDKVRFLKYDKPGNFFLPHEDGAQERNEFERSVITFQIYLSEGMEGGETGFIETCFPDVTQFERAIANLEYNREDMIVCQKLGRGFSFDKRISF